MATPGNDFLFFQGELQSLSQILTNPYSGLQILIDDEFNVNNTFYDGLGGNDVLIGTENGDFFDIVNPAGQQTIKNVEVFIAGNGGDVIQFADAEVTYGDITIRGGNGDDILWANVGNDLVTGFNGDDILDGGPGHDRLLGENDNDIIFGGEGDDFLSGGNGNDTLYGGTDLGLIELDRDFVDDITFPDLIEGTDIVNLVPPGTPALGINNDNLTVSFDATATLTFREGFAGFNNTLGIYKIADDGTIENADILFANVKTAGLNNAQSIELPVGEEGGEFGFFIIANGDRVNNGYSGLDITGDDVISFIYDFGGANERAAMVTDDGGLVSVVYNDGTTVLELRGPDYHTTPRGETPDINFDGEVHALSGIVEAGNDDVLRIGFEDLPNLGDADYEDVLFDLDIDAVRVDASEVGADVLIGGAGDDVLYGEAGNDILVIGNGLDDAYGGSGSDIFVYDVADSFVDTIHDFETGVGQDVLNIADILEGYDPLADAIADFVQLSSDGEDTVISINTDGDAGGEFVDIAVVNGGLNDTLVDLIDNGNLVADQSVIF